MKIVRRPALLVTSRGFSTNHVQNGGVFVLVVGFAADGNAHLSLIRGGG